MSFTLILAISIPFLTFFGIIAILIHQTGNGGDEGSDKPKLYEREILDYYKKFDLLYDRPPGKVGGKNIGDPSHLSSSNAKVIYTFIGLSSKNKAVVFDGELKSKSELEDKTHLIKKVSLKKLLGYTNVRARVRKRKMEGAKAFCEVEHSEAEKEREKRHHKKIEFETLESLPCNMVERTKTHMGQRKLES